ncbi:hypothetical protein ACX3PU_06075 [Chryseobacterium sp. A301]
MKNLVLIGAMVLAVVSCNKKTETTTVEPIDSSGIFIDEANVTDSTLASTSTCYFEVIGKDTLFAKINNNLGTITGSLRYKNFEKDSSFGDLAGIANGDTLKVDYVFQAEGTTSTREIWFLQKDGKLIEGIGDYDDSGERYATPKVVKFESGHSLTEADCNLIASKLKP